MKTLKPDTYRQYIYIESLKVRQFLGLGTNLIILKIYFGQNLFQTSVTVLGIDFVVLFNVSL